MDLYRYNFTAEEEAATVRKQFEECHRIFRAELFEGAGQGGEPISCRINDAFESMGADHHNCLGCNLADMINLIESFLKTSPLLERLHYAYTNYILLNYLLVERIDTLFELIQLNKPFWEDNFKILRIVRRWANFIKHPKAFLLTHHAEYTFIGSPKNTELEKHAAVKIDRDFIDKFYADNSRNKDLYKELENKDKVLVIFPEATYVTREMCIAMRMCIEIIEQNPVYRGVLEKQATFLNYWTDVSSA